MILQYIGNHTIIPMAIKQPGSILVNKRDPFVDNWARFYKHNLTFCVECGRRGLTFSIHIVSSDWDGSNVAVKETQP